MAVCSGGQRKLRNGSWYSYHYRKGKAGHYYNNDCDNDDDHNDYHHRRDHNNHDCAYNDQYYNDRNHYHNIHCCGNDHIDYHHNHRTLYDHFQGNLYQADKADDNSIQLYKGFKANGFDNNYNNNDFFRINDYNDLHNDNNNYHYHNNDHNIANLLDDVDHYYNDNTLDDDIYRNHNDRHRDYSKYIQQYCRNNRKYNCDNSVDGDQYHNYHFCDNFQFHDNHNRTDDNNSHHNFCDDYNKAPTAAAQSAWRCQYGRACGFAGYVRADAVYCEKSSRRKGRSI